MEAILLDNISDYLGPAATRFFSAGYKRAEYRLDHQHVHRDEHKASLEASLNVAYPADWSKKGDKDQTPHLSTVDALVLGMRLCDFLASKASATPTELLSVGAVRIQSGNAPQEDLDGIPVTAELSAPRDGAPGKYTCKVGTLKVSFELRGQAPVEKIADDNADLVDRFWEDGFKRAGHDITDLSVRAGERVISASVRIEVPNTSSQEIAARTRPRVPLTEAFVICVQLVQVLLYEIDGVSRADSNTLWMLKTKITSGPKGASRASLSCLPAEAVITCKEEIKMNQRLWSYIEFASSVGDVKVEAAFAHDISDKRLEVSA